MVEWLRNNNIVTLFGCQHPFGTRLLGFCNTEVVGTRFIDLPSCIFLSFFFGWMGECSAIFGDMASGFTVVLHEC